MHSQGFVHGNLSTGLVSICNKKQTSSWLIWTNIKCDQNQQYNSYGWLFVIKQATKKYLKITAYPCGLYGFYGFYHIILAIIKYSAKYWTEQYTEKSKPKNER